jgi:hypothetical protein
VHLLVDYTLETTERNPAHHGRCSTDGIGTGASGVPVRGTEDH